MTDAEIIFLINNSLVEEFELESSAMVSEAEIFADLGPDSLDIVDCVSRQDHAGAEGTQPRIDEGNAVDKRLGLAW